MMPLHRGGGEAAGARVSGPKKGNQSSSSVLESSFQSDSRDHASLEVSGEEMQLHHAGTTGREGEGETIGTLPSAITR